MFDGAVSWAFDKLNLYSRFVVMGMKKLCKLFSSQLVQLVR